MACFSSTRMQCSHGWKRMDDALMCFYSKWNATLNWQVHPAELGKVMKEALEKLKEQGIHSLND